MMTIGNELVGVISRVKENISAPGSMLAPDNVANTNYLPMDSPFIEFGDSTVRRFVYGISEYGGEDIIVQTTSRRFINRYYLNIE